MYGILIIFYMWIKIITEYVTELSLQNFFDRFINTQNSCVCITLSNKKKIYSNHYKYIISSIGNTSTNIILFDLIEYSSTIQRVMSIE